MTPASLIILKYVCPAFGVVTGSVMFSAPVKDVIDANRRGYLGDLNPLPWVATLSNCIGWIAYSCYIRDVWIFFVNAPALILSVWLNTSAVKLQYIELRTQRYGVSILDYSGRDKQSYKPSLLQQITLNSSFDDSEREERVSGERYIVDDSESTTPTPQERALLAVATFWVGILSLLCFWESAPRDTILGTCCLLNLIFFYGSPLSTIFTVIRTQDSSSIHVWTMVTNTFNSAFWFTYGLTIFNPFVFGPNAVGTLLSLVQVALYFIYPRKPKSRDDELVNASSLLLSSSSP